MARVPIFGTGKEGKSVTVSSQRLVNLFPEISTQPDRSILTLYPTPGLVDFTDFGDTPARGTHVSGDLLYEVHRNTFWEVNNAGVRVARGVINTSSGLVSMADNGGQVMVVDGLDGWIFTIATLAFSQIIDADFPNGATVVVYADAFFIVNSPISGQFNKSATFNGLSWDPLDFATAEYAPDGLVSIISHQGFLGLLGLRTIEGWQNSPGLNFPYQRVSGAVIEWGLAARNSIAKYNNSFMFLATNRLGGAQVVMIENFLPRVISGPDMDAEIAKYDSLSDAVAFSYFQGGHSFYHITFPQALESGAGKSWIYDLDSENWSEVQSGNGGQHRALLGVFFVDRYVVSDFSNGKLYDFDQEHQDDAGVVIERELISRHIFDELRQSISSLWLDIEPGVGTDLITNPQVVLTISRDGGHTYGNGLPAPMGGVGSYLKRCRWSRLGKARDWTFKFRLTEAVKWVVTGAWMNTAEP